MKIKSLKYLALAMFAGSVMLTSCEKDPEVFDAPTIAFEGTNSKILDIAEGPAYNLEFNVIIAAPGKIEKITIERSKLLNGKEVGEVLPVVNPKFDNLTEAAFMHSDNIKYNEFTNGTIDQIVYKVVVNDGQGEIVSSDFTVTMGEYAKLESEKEGEIWKIQSKNGKGCWNLKADVAVTAIENDVDVVASRYMINNNGVSTLDSETNFDGSWSSDEVVWFRHGAPNEPVSAKGNGTKFVKANDYDYAMAIKEVAMSLFDAAGEEGQLTAINAPAVDDIYIAVLGEEIYVIKITEIVKEEEATAKLNSGVIRFTYKK